MGTRMRINMRKALLIVMALMLSLTVCSLAKNDVYAAAKRPKAPSKIKYIKEKTEHTDEDGDVWVTKAVNVKVSKVKKADGYQLKYRTREYWHEYYTGKDTISPQKWSKWKKKKVKEGIANHVLMLGSASVDAKVQIKVRSYRTTKKGKKVYSNWKTFKPKHYKGGYRE